MKLLSEMESRVAEAYCHGMSDKEISSYLHMAVWTVRTHKKHIYRKIGAHNEQMLVLFCVSDRMQKEWAPREVEVRGLNAIF